MYQFATAAYAATARLALTGVELQAEALFASAGRLRGLLDRWPVSQAEAEGALDHAARVWSLVLGSVLDDPDMPDEGLETAERLAATVFSALREGVEAPGPETIDGLLRLTTRYAASLRQASGPSSHGGGARPIFQRLRRKSSTSAFKNVGLQPGDESRVAQSRVHPS